jgi:tRNA(Arg) A34 adenosine deaminase TadA
MSAHNKNGNSMKLISRPSIVNLAVEAAKKSKGTHSIGAVITYGTRKPVISGCNTNKRTVYRFGSNRMIACSQHAEMSVASRFLNGARAGKMSRVRGVRKKPKGALRQEGKCKVV